ncbi:MAG: methyltransferase [Hyphomicrobiales bacterium]|nr:methyltransferase [Hyphomicrobiales bacterium]
MFYGNFRNKADGEFFQTAIKRFRGIFGSVYANDNVILFDRTLGFRRDRELMQAFRHEAKSDQEKSLLLRINTLAWAGQQALLTEGDFVECGVWRGFCSSVIARYLDFGTLDRKYYLYDTFQGIPEDQDGEGHNSPLFREEGLYESVVERFARYPNVRVIRGKVPDILHVEAPSRIAMLHIDMNSSAAEIAALDVLFDRVVSGGIIVFDDYGWRGYRAQQLAEDEWVGKRGQRILELPSGQGLLVKR